MELATGAATITEPREQSVQLEQLEPLITAVVDHIRAAPGLERVTVVDAARRRVPRVSSIVLLAAGSPAAAVLRQFARFPRAESVEIEHWTRGSMRLDGIAVQLRVVAGRCFGAAQLCYTGPDRHVRELRARAVAAGLRLSEFGVFQVSEPDGRRLRGGARRIGGRDEEDVYRLLQLAVIEPELRDRPQSIDQAARGTLPVLITAADLRWDLRAARANRATEDHAALPDRVALPWCELTAGRSTTDDLRWIEQPLLESSPVPAGVLVFGTVRRRDLEALRATGTGDCFGRSHVLSFRGAAPLDLQLIRAAVAHGCAVEVAPDTAEAIVQAATSAGARLVLVSGARASAELGRIRFALDRARRAGATAAALLNTLDARALRHWMAHRSSSVQGTP